MRHLATLTANLSGVVQERKLHGKTYLVAPVTMIREGVLHGNRGPVLYTNAAVNKNVQRWNNMPLVLGHPENAEGIKVSARDPEVLNQYGLGFIFNARYDGGLKAEAWFDIDRTTELAPIVLRDIRAKKPVELSTGLFTQTANKAGEHNGKPYTHELVNYDPDHLAILVGAQGACSLADGCGVLVNSSQEDLLGMELAVNAYNQAKTSLPFSKWIKTNPNLEPTTNCDDCGCDKCKGKKPKKPVPVPGFEPTGNNCGIGSGGFQPGNKCAKGGGGGVPITGGGGNISMGAAAMIQGMNRHNQAMKGAKTKMSYEARDYNGNRQTVKVFQRKDGKLSYEKSDSMRNPLEVRHRDLLPEKWSKTAKKEILEHFKKYDHLDLKPAPKPTTNNISFQPRVSVDVSELQFQVTEAES